MGLLINLDHYLNKFDLTKTEKGAICDLIKKVQRENNIAVKKAIVKEFYENYGDYPIRAVYTILKMLEWKQKAARN